jgi:tRNA-intron endonuclease
VKASFDGTMVRVGKEGRALYDQSGYGRLEQEGVKLSDQEALYLLHRHKIEITGYAFNSLFSEFANRPGFLRSFLVYRDLRERGYVVQAGPHDFRVFKRGEKPGTGESLYLVRVLSERDPIRFVKLIEEVVASRNMRKQYVLAVVDDEEELTYYEIKLQKLAEPDNNIPDVKMHEALLVGKTGMVLAAPQSDLERWGFGKRFDDERLMLAPVELLYLMGKGIIELRKDGIPVRKDEYFVLAGDVDSELAEKDKVYTELRGHNFTPRTGYKFGHHFRVYCGRNVHSDMLVHAVEKETSLPMSAISRSVRMAHSVKKKMLFGAVHTKGIQFVEFARIKL